MDLTLYGQILWRHRLVVVLGVILATVFAFLAVAQVDWHDRSVSYRSNEVWRNSTALLLTQPGFPEGRSVFPYTGQPSETLRYADPRRFGDLAELYAQIAISDPVRRRILASGPIDGTIGAVAQSGTSGNPSPIVNVLGAAATPEKATKLARRATDALLAYLKTRQAAARIPESQRVDVQVLRSDDSPFLVKPRRKTLPVIVFLAVLTITVALAFVLENASRRSAHALESVDAVGDTPIGSAEEPRLVRDAGQRVS